MGPVILVTADRRAPTGFADSPRVRPRRPEAFIGESYLEALRRAGAVPLVLPPGPSDVERILDRVDAVVLTGGDFDIHPSHYGEAVVARIDRVEPGRTDLELEVARSCLRRDLPLLGVCGGMQALAVAAGGSLVQDLPKIPLDHEQPGDPATPGHALRLDPAVARWFEGVVAVNSTHHQAVKQPGEGLVAAGWAPDGVVEVIWGPAFRFVLGVQWHPELLGQQGVYEGLVRAALRGD